MAKIIIEIESNQLPEVTVLGIGMPFKATVSVTGNKNDKHDIIPVLVANKLAACYSESLNVGLQSALKSVIEETANE